VCDQETSKNEEAKARYRAVENTTTMGCNARKTNIQTNKYRKQQLGARGGDKTRNLEEVVCLKQKYHLIKGKS
jgi:hypothetical protein